MQEYKKYICVICGFIYDEAEGWPEDGIDPGTLWADVPENWFCPDCGAGKEDFDMVEMDQLCWVKRPEVSTRFLMDKI